MVVRSETCFVFISHGHQLISLKTNKTAGTTIATGVSRFSGADDVTTLVFAEDEKIFEMLGSSELSSPSVKCLRPGHSALRGNP